MTKEKVTIACEAVFSDNSEHRYLLSKVWDKSKPIANVITISPSEDYNISSDLTTQLITNNVYKLRNYGGFVLTNIISRIGLNVKRLKSTDNLYNEETDKYILAAAEKSDTVIWAIGKFADTRKDFCERKQEILKLLKPFESKLFMITDSNGREFCHPLVPSVRQGWILKKLRL